jgi:hypothetical protein
MPLNRAPNTADPDALYTALIGAHADLTEVESQALNARLILLLANHIGDLETVREAVEVARRSVGRAD